MITLLYVLMIFACVIIIGCILLQPSKGGGISALGGSNQSVFGSTGGNSFLFNVTMWSAAFIMVAAIVVSRYQINKNKSSVFDDAPLTTAPGVPAPSTPSDPTQPAAGTTPAAGGAAGAPASGPAAGAPGTAPAPTGATPADPAKTIPSTPNQPGVPPSSNPVGGH